MGEKQKDPNMSGLPEWATKDLQTALDCSYREARFLSTVCCSEEVLWAARTMTKLRPHLGDAIEMAMYLLRRDLSWTDKVGWAELKAMSRILSLSAVSTGILIDVTGEPLCLREQLTADQDAKISRYESLLTDFRWRVDDAIKERERKHVGEMFSLLNDTLADAVNSPPR